MASTTVTVKVNVRFTVCKVKENVKNLVSNVKKKISDDRLIKAHHVRRSEEPN